MDQILHGSARTTPAVRQAIQASTESLAKLAIRYGLNEKAVAKWRGRPTTQDAPMGPKNPASTVLSPLKEAAALTFRQHTQLPLDDCLYALQERIPHLSRSALHRLFQRHGVSQLPVAESLGKATKKQFKDYAIGYFHVAFTELRLADGKLYLFVAIDRTSKLAFAELHPALAAAFWQRVVQAMPYTITNALTDNGVQFTQLPIGAARWPTASTPSARPTASSTAAPKWRTPGPTAKWNGSIARSKRRPSSSTTTRMRPSLTRTCRPFYRPVMAANGSKSCMGRRPTSL